MNTILLTIALTLSSSLSFAHGDHPPRVAPCISKECTKEQVETAVPMAVELLTKTGKIESSWSSAKVEKVEKKDFKKSPEWVATLLDEKQPEGKKRRYIFITTKGYLNGSNLTGE
ncbi:MAG: DUF6488 family protein [Bdellovibrionota bacterium]